MLNLPAYRQRPGFCGPASLKIALGYYGVDVSEAELGRLSGCTAESGVGTKGIVRAAKAFGFTATVIDHATMAMLKDYAGKRKLAVIVDWFSTDGGHYSVVAGVDARNIYLQDPELGHLRAMKIETFLGVWFDYPQDYPRTNKDFILRRMIVIATKKQTAPKRTK